jgi:hypothetical protein
MNDYYDDARERGRQWDDDNWQPETGRDTWQSERMRRRMTPGQTSYGGPHRRSSDERYGRQYGNVDRYGSEDERYNTSERNGGGNRRNEGRRYGSDLRYGLNGGYGWERASEWRSPQAWQRDDRYAEREWRESAERARATGRGTAGRDSYFSDLRSDTRYWTEPGGDWTEDQRYGRRYSREAAQRRGWEVDDDRDDEHGALYHLGRRIGEAVGDWFGTTERHQRPAGPRGYHRSDERIRDQICERLSYARHLDVSDVSVDVKDGVVSLSGTVNNRSQKYYIEELVDATYGVSEVNNEIRVRRGSGTALQSASNEVTGSTWRG